MFYARYNPNEHKVQRVQTDLTLYSLFVHVFPKVIRQANSTDYDVLAIKYMEMWNDDTYRINRFDKPYPTLSTIFVIRFNMGNHDILC